MTNVIYLLVFYVMSSTTGYVDKAHTIPQYVSGPYKTEAECTGHLAADTEPQTASEGLVKDYECILVEEDKTT